MRKPFQHFIQHGKNVMLDKMLDWFAPALILVRYVLSSMFLLWNISIVSKKIGFNLSFNNWFPGDSCFWLFSTLFLFMLSVGVHSFIITYINMWHIIKSLWEFQFLLLSVENSVSMTILFLIILLAWSRKFLSDKWENSGWIISQFCFIRFIYPITGFSLAFV